MTAVTYSCVIGAIELFYPAYLDRVTHNLTSHSMMVWLSIFYLGFFGSALGFWWFNKKIRSIAPARASVFINIVPVNAIFPAWLLLNKRITFSLIVGVLMVTSGVYLTNRGDGLTHQPYTAVRGR